MAMSQGLVALPALPVAASAVGRCSNYLTSYTDLPSSDRVPDLQETRAEQPSFSARSLVYRASDPCCRGS